MITDMSGAILQEQSFNPWGERRTASNWQSVLTTFDPEFTFAVTGLVHSGTTHGFTGHEMLDAVGIIHMNGRIYDAKLGRFLQADPFVQAPTNTQSMNRYSYGWNNPLNGTDPSGYGWLSDTWNSVKGFVKELVVQVLFAAVSSLCGPAAACYGTLNGAYAYSNGASLGEAITIGVTAGVGKHYGGESGKIGGWLLILHNSECTVAQVSGN